MITTISFHLGMCLNVNEVVEDFGQQMDGIGDSTLASDRVSVHLTEKISFHTDIIR